MLSFQTPYSFLSVSKILLFSPDSTNPDVWGYMDGDLDLCNFKKHLANGKNDPRILPRFVQLKKNQIRTQ